MLDRLLVSIPHTDEDVEERARAVRTCVTVLGRVGIDGENLIRYGMARREAVAIYITIIASDSGLLQEVVEVDRWRSLLHVDVPSRQLDEVGDGDQTARSHVAHVPQQLDKWVMNAPFADVLGWVPPRRTNGV